jgi:hypothetical protein
MSEQSQKDEMNAAIRAQRQRHNVPRSIAPAPPAAAAPKRDPEPEPEPAKGFLARLLGR